MEFVIVRFRDKRTVFIDGSPQGKTNEIQRVDAGPHSFDLGAGDDYTPPQIDRDVQNTDFPDPMEIVFVPKAAAAAAGMAAPASGAIPAGSKKSARKKRARKKTAKKKPSRATSGKKRRKTTKHK